VTTATDTLTPAEILEPGARFSVRGFGGIAFYCVGYSTYWTEEAWTYCGEGDPDDEASYLYDEPEEVEDLDFVRMVMVGDDEVHVVDVSDLVPIEADDYCSVCGQIGCTADGR
jgi:hypothetical protein